MKPSTTPISRYRDKKAIRHSAYYMGRRLIIAIFEFRMNNQRLNYHVTGAAYVIEVHVKAINQLLELYKQNGMNLTNNLRIRLCTGKKVLFSEFRTSFNADIAYFNSVLPYDLIIRDGN